MPYIYIDSDGRPGSTTVLVCGDDGACLGELHGVQRIDWSLEATKYAAAQITVSKVKGRFLANDVLIRELKSDGLTARMTDWLGRSLRRVLRRG